MLATAPETTLRAVRALLLLGWLVLLASLFWDPVTPRLTDPSNGASPFRVDDSSVVVIQGEALRSEPYAMGNRIFWSMIVPLVPLFLLVVGHEAWRRVCPLSFVSQLPRIFGIQRKRRNLNRRTGVVKPAVVLPERQGWWRRHALDVHVALLFVGLNARILFVNADRIALAVFLISILVIVLLVGWLWGGKTWCNYLCPLGTIQKVYTGPGGLLESRPHIAKPATPQSICRAPSSDGDVSTCVGCMTDCPDIDRERSYWESLQDPSVRRLYYGLFGLIVGFYGFYYLYSGGWDYYYSGFWTHEPGQLSKLLGPGLYLNGQTLAIPKLVTAPLVIGFAFALSYALWIFTERAWTALSMRRWPEQTATRALHQVLTVCAFVSINTFYLFAGRGNLALLPTPVVRAVDILIVLLTTLWLVRTLRRQPLAYRQESLAASLRAQIEKIPVDFPRLLDGRALKYLEPAEIYVLARTLPEVTQVQRLRAYRSLVEDLIRTHRIEQSSSDVLLREMREAIGISEKEHRDVLLELGITTTDSTRSDHSAVFENWLRRDNYRIACEALLLAELRPGRSLNAVIGEQENRQPMRSLIEIYQITPSEHQQALVQISSRAGLLYERALRDLDRLGEDAALAFALNLELLAHQHRFFEGAIRLLLSERRAQSRPAIERILSTLVALGPTPETNALAQRLRALVGARIETMIEEPVQGGRGETWVSVLPSAATRMLRGDFPDDSDALEGASLSAYPDLVAAAPPLTEQLEALVDDGSQLAALALWVLAVLAPRTAREHADIQPEDGTWARAVKRPLAAYSIGEESELLSEIALPEPVLAALNVSRCRIFADLRLTNLAELAQLATTLTRNQGEIVFRGRDQVETIIVLVSGQCRSYPDGQRFDAEVEVVAFGVTALLSPCRYRQAIRVESRTATFMNLPRASVSSWLRRQPTCAAAVFASLAKVGGDVTSASEAVIGGRLAVE